MKQRDDPFDEIFPWVCAAAAAFASKRWNTTADWYLCKMPVRSTYEIFFPSLS